MMSRMVKVGVPIRCVEPSLLNVGAHSQFYMAPFSQGQWTKGATSEVSKYRVGAYLRTTDTTKQRIKELTSSERADD